MLIRNTDYSKKKPSFKSASALTTQVLRCLNTNPSLGATSIDILSMSAPRTVIDGVDRGFDAGVETGIREGSGTANHALIGAYGIGASALLSKGINSAFDVKANKVYANFEGIDTIGSIWHDITKANEKASPIQLRKMLFERVLTQVRGNASSTDGRLHKVAIDKNSLKSFMEELSDYMDKNPKSYNIPQKLYLNLKEKL